MAHDVLEAGVALFQRHLFFACCPLAGLLLGCARLAFYASRGRSAVARAVGGSEPLALPLCCPLLHGSSQNPARPGLGQLLLSDGCKNSLAAPGKTAPAPQLHLLAVLGYIFASAASATHPCVSALGEAAPRPARARGSPLRGAEFLAPKRACGAWCGAYALGTLPPARFLAHPGGPEAFLRVFLG